MYAPDAGAGQWPRTGNGHAHGCRGDQRPIDPAIAGGKPAPWSYRCAPGRSTRAWIDSLAGGFDQHRQRSPVVDLAMDWRMLGFTSGITVLTCVLFGLAPALRATRVSPGAVLKSRDRKSTRLNSSHSQISYAV